MGVELVRHLGLLQQPRLLRQGLVAIGEVDFDGLRRLVVAVVLDVVHGVSVQRRGDVPDDIPLAHEAAELDGPLQSGERLEAGFGGGLVQMGLLGQILWPAAIGPIVEVLHHLVDLLGSVLCVSALREERPGHVLDLGLPVEVEGPGLDQWGRRDAQPHDALRALPRCAHGLQILLLVAVGMVNSWRGRPTGVATDGRHAGVGEERGPSLTQQDLPALRVSVRQLTVVFVLVTIRRRRRDLPSGEWDVVHPAAAHGDEARVLGAF
mmetsp:Transcript_29672/g.59174  ORF Transcript_29672/g.59174 Transcript_29672/m.59174 type:complete len:265 (-) Transcript_29672:171-965(-)